MLEPPKDIDELRQFLDLVGFYRRFIPFFADVTVCLSTMLGASLGEAATCADPGGSSKYSKTGNTRKQLFHTWRCGQNSVVMLSG